MKTESCGTQNPLVREGKSQKQRFTTGLDTSYVKVDERSTADLLVWASKFAKELRYYSPDNLPDGDWSDFVNGDISTRIALIAVTDTADLKDQWAQKVQQVRDTIARYSIIEDQETVRADVEPELIALFEFLLANVARIDTQAKQVIDHEVYSLELRNTIKSRLRRHFRNLVEYAKGATVVGLFKYPNPQIENSVTKNPVTPGIIGFSLDWFEQTEAGPSTLAKWLEDNNTPPNTQAYGTGIVQEKVAAILDRLDFTFRGFYEGQFLIVSQAEAFLTDTLSNWDTHKPHMALLITFLLLFKNAQDHINTFTERHLEFYYKQVLQISEAAATPDEVHVVFTIAKNVFSHAVSAGTVLSAGKDKKGKELNYALDDDNVLNTGLVDTISTVFVDAADNGRVYMAPVANSGDGLGGDFSATSTKAWRPFGQVQTTLEEGETTMIKADIGFAVASPILNLSEGLRTITFNLAFEPDTWIAFQKAKTAALLKFNSDDLQIIANQPDFKVSLTNKKGWYDVDEGSLTVEEDTYTRQLRIKVTLEKEVLPITGYVEKVHKAAMGTSDPVAKFVMNNDSLLCPYGHMSLLKMKSIKILVDVQEVKGLVVQSDIAALSPDKAFQPFGPRPAVGSNFYIGHHEAFSKKLDNFKIHIQWAKQPPVMGAHYTLYNGIHTDASFTAGISLLDRRTWYPLKSDGSTASVQLLIDGATASPTSGTDIRTTKVDGITTIEVNTLTIDSKYALDRQTDLEKFTAWTTSIPKGFVKLTLNNQDFGHDQFPRIYARQAINFSNDVTTTDLAEIALAKQQGLKEIVANPQEYQVPLPNDPYTPEISSISLDYTSSVLIDLTYRSAEPAAADAEPEMAFHLHPFGLETLSPTTYDAGILSQEGPATSDVGDPFIYLLPQFDGEGLLYIGISGMNLDISSNLALLFQVMEGTANPDIDKPDITWAYRTANTWEAFGIDSTGDDDTNGLVTSGILKLGLPSDASNVHSILKNSLHWIRGSVDRTKALPLTSVVSGLADVLTVSAQAAKATFVDNGNDPIHLAQALAAETITKLKVKEAEVKAVAQPYASFNGRMVEADQSFYTRVSERLRHKDRSIAIWDYETMVLERFPSVYRVKCLNHTSETAQVAPGSVYLVVVSNLVNKNAVDPLKPRISVNTLLEIHEFLAGKISPFVKLLVKNPNYEEIKVEFDVQFTADITDTGYYKNLLQQDILRFLTPWADEAGADINFEGKLHSSVILDFVEELGYVDFLTDFKMYHIVDPDHPEAAVQVDEAIASTPMSILVSAAEHSINLYQKTTI